MGLDIHFNRVLEFDTIQDSIKNNFIIFQYFGDGYKSEVLVNRETIDCFLMKCALIHDTWAMEGERDTYYFQYIAESEFNFEINPKYFENNAESFIEHIKQAIEVLSSIYKEMIERNEYYAVISFNY